MAGLIAGPIVGIGAGVIGAVHRYSLGGFTAASCSMSTILAGLIGGIINSSRKGKFVTVAEACLIGILIEAVHMGMILAVSPPFDQALIVVQSVFVPMALANAMGMGLFTLIIRNIAYEQKTLMSKKLIEEELKAAREIQMSMIPKNLSPSHQRDFQLNAVLEPAKEVGGDFYDFFFIAEGKLAFVIGDVSGKGVPAAIFMAVTKTLLKSKASTESDPQRILMFVNDELSRDNETSMFATFFFGILDTHTGKISYCCAGHNPPVIVRKDASLEYIEGTGSLPLGVRSGAEFIGGELTMTPDDTIILYTDGVTEAMNKEGALFSNQRLVDILSVGHVF